MWSVVCLTVVFTCASRPFFSCTTQGKSNSDGMMMGPMPNDGNPYSFSLRYLSIQGVTDFKLASWDPATQSVVYIPISLVRNPLPTCAATATAAAVPRTLTLTASWQRRVCSHHMPLLRIAEHTLLWCRVCFHHLPNIKPDNSSDGEPDVNPDNATHTCSDAGTTHNGADLRSDRWLGTC